jgi:hypothetical protein
MHELAEQFIQSLPQETLEHHIDHEGPYEDRSTFSDDGAEIIATELQTFIASVIASLIDAGSEREAIMEDEQLHAALITTLKGW